MRMEDDINDTIAREDLITAVALPCPSINSAPLAMSSSTGITSSVCILIFDPRAANASQEVCCDLC